MINKKDLIFLSSAISLGLSFILLFVWSISALNGGVAYVSVNEYGECLPELFLWIIIVPLMLEGFYYHYKEWYNGSSSIFKTKKE